MTMTTVTSDGEIMDVRADALAVLEERSQGIQHVDAAALASINRSEIEMQIDAAHRYPRSIGRFLKEAIAMATLTPETSESCLYALPRRERNERGEWVEKIINGPSVRLAEICASAYGNMHVGMRTLDADASFITGQGVAWDIERNVRFSVEVQRRITGKKGNRYNDDMIVLTGNAAAAIAKRNAIFNVVPRAYVQQVYDAARKVAVGDAHTLSARRDALFRRLAALGITKERVLEKVGKPSIEDVSLEDYEVLIGIGTAIKDDPSKLEEFFPSARPAPTATAAASLEEKLRAGVQGKTAPAADKTTSGAPPSTAAPAEPTREPGEEG